MIHTFEDLCTYVYVTVDEVFQTYVQPHDQRPGPRSPFSESEVITLTLVAELVGLDDETVFLDYVNRNHRALFPLLPDRSRYNRPAGPWAKPSTRFGATSWGGCSRSCPLTTARAVCSTVCRCPSSASTMPRGGSAGMAGPPTATMPPNSRPSMGSSSIS